MPAPHLLAADTYSLTAGRSWSLVAAALGLAAVVIGVLAMARLRRAGPGPGSWRRGAIAALSTGLAGAAIGALVVAAADGGPGTGSGIVGGFAALAVGLVGSILGGLALTRSRQPVARAVAPSVVDRQS